MSGLSRDDIISMAREAGFDFNLLGATFTSGYLDQHLERFAALVAAAEREACAKAVSDVLYGQDGCGKAIEAIRARGSVNER
jgi:hypothetical protein